MTDCPDGLMRDLLPEYAVGVLGAEDAAQVSAHLASCAACQAELALLGQLRSGLSLGVPRVDVAAIVGALPAAPSAATPHRAVRSIGAGRWSTRHVWQYAAAAGLVLAVGSGLVWRTGPGREGSRVADTSLARTANETTSARLAPRSDDGITFGGGLSDLSLNDLQSLLGQIDSVRALPSTDPESVTPVIAMNEGGKTL